MKRYLILFLIIPFVVFSQSSFEKTGWQFHEYNIPKLEQAIKKAPEYGVNFFIFSHTFFRSVEGFLQSDENYNPDKTPQLPHLARLYRSGPHHTKPHSQWQKDVKYIGGLAEKQGIPYYLWIHEFDDIPEKYKIDGLVNFDHPQLFPFITKRYEDLLKVLPNAAGFCLTLHESHNKIFRNTEVASDFDVPERIYRLTKLIYDVAKAHGKKLILRNFFYEPLEMEYFQYALAKLPDDLICMSKTTFHEFDPFYPPDSMHGNVGNKKQIIEIDLGIEKAWSSAGVYAQTEYIQRFVRRAKLKNLAGMVGRARLFWDHPFENVHEINLFAFSRFMENPDLTVDQVVTDWAAKRYSEGAVPFIASAIKRTQFINHHGRYFLSFWLTKSIGSEWGDYKYYFGHLKQRSFYKWTKNPNDLELEEKLYNPDWATYKKLVAEKDQVISKIKASMDDLSLAGRHMTAGQLAPLQDGFEMLT
jgi:hypothetical protein